MARNPALDALLQLAPGASRYEVPTRTQSNRISLPWTNLQTNKDLSRMSPQAGVDDFNQGLQTETEERLFNAVRAGNAPNDVSALKFMLGNIESDLDASPIQQGIKANQAASLEGFPSSQAQSQYGMRQAEQKLQQPLDIARTQAQTQRDVAASNRQAEVDKFMGAERTRAENVRRFDELRGMLKPGERVSVPGAGSAARPTPTAAPNVNSLTTALAQERARASGGDVDSQAAIAQLEQAMVGASGLDPESQDILFDILGDPQLSGMDIEEALQEFDLQGLDVQALANTFNRIRGLASAPPPEPSLMKKIGGW